MAGRPKKVTDGVTEVEGVEIEANGVEIEVKPADVVETVEVVEVKTETPEIASTPKVEEVS